MKIKVNIKGLMLLAFFAALSNFALAQKTVTGKVTDGKEPLPFASVVVTGTSTGTQTDLDGNYSLEVPNGAPSLTASFAGYASQTVAIGGSSEINFELASSVLDEVVVVGYGSVKSREVTSSVASIKSGDFNKGNISSPAQLLQGKVAGLVVATPAGGNPNAQAQIRLRGISTFGANSSPLIIVDGIPNVPLNLVDPNDIESFDVLRDGSASAIYGVQASSGVILITTKKGSLGKTTVDYSGQITSESVATRPSMMTAQEYLDANVAAGNAVADVDKGGRTNWYDEVTRTALSHVHNLSLGGSAGKGGTYRASFNYRDQNGVAYDGYKQLNARLNLNQRALNNKLNLNFDFSTTDQSQTFVQEAALEQASKYVPTAPVYITNTSNPLFTKYGGFYQQEGGFDQYNPKAIQEQLTNESTRKRYTLSGKADLDIVEGLKWSNTYSMTRESELNGNYTSRYSFFGGGRDRSGIAGRGTYNKDINFFNSYLNYTKDLGSKSNINATVGYEYQNTLYEGYNVSAAGFLTDLTSYNNLGSASDLAKAGQVSVNSYKGEEILSSFFGRVGYNYNQIASVSASVRRDGSSKFSAGKPWGLFPAVSAAVYLDKLVDLKGINQLKLKVGYGQTGALPTDRYLTLPGYVIGRDSSINAVRNANPSKLTWEKKAELNIGLDFAALDSRLTGSIDFFNRDITDLLYTYAVPPGIFEFPSLTVNAGTLNTNGLDIQVGYDVLKGQKLQWKTSLVASTFSSKLVSLTTEDKLLSIGGRFTTANAGSPGQNSTPYTLVEEGAAIGNFYGFRYAGADATQGLLVYNYKGEIVPITAANDSSKTTIGNGLPKWVLGFNNTFQYGNFDFNFFIRGVFGHDIVNEYRVFYENANGGSLKSYNRVLTKYWDPNIKDAAYTSYHVEKGDFIRLDNFTLGYNVPVKANKSGISKVRVFLSGNNLMTITGYTGINPEVRFLDGDNGFAPGIERRSNYFTTRSFTFGVNVGF